MNLAQRAQIIENFLHELGNPAVTAVSFSPYSTSVQLDQPHPDFDYQVTRGTGGTHYVTETIRKELFIHLSAYVLDEEVSA